MSRGIDTIDTVLPTGSSETTIIVSVRDVLRPTPESTPTTSPVTRGTVGVADGATDAEGSGDPDGAGSRLLGSGSGVKDGPAATGFGSTNTSSAVSRATSVA